MSNIITRWQRISAGLELYDPGTFLAQGAFGGGIACFLLTLFRVVYPKGVYNLLLIHPFLFYLLPSMIVGVVLAAAVWLSDAIRNRKSRFLSGCAIGVGTTGFLAIPYGLSPAWRPFEWRLFFLSSLIPASLAGLLTGFIAVLKLNPLRVIVLGPAKLSTLRTFSSWLVSMAGFPLRVGSFLGIPLALLLLAYFFSNANAGWLSPAQGDNRQTLVGTTLALLYFILSAFASSTSLRKLTLVGLAALVNAPLTVWALDQSTQADTSFLTISTLLFISAWILLILARTIMPDSKRSGEDQTSTQLVTGEAPVAGTRKSSR